MIDYLYRNEFANAIRQYRILEIFFTIFFALFFITSNEYYHSRFFYFFVVPVFFFLLRPDYFLYLVKQSKVFLLVLLYMAVLLISLFWSKNIAVYDVVLQLVDAISIIILLACGVYIFSNDNKFLLLFLKLIAWAAYIGALVFIYTKDYEIGDRFYDMARGNNPMKTASLYGILGIALFFCVLPMCKGKLEKVIYFILASFILLLALLTLSRAAALALLVIMVSLLLLKRQGLVVALFVCCLSLLLFVLYKYNFADEALTVLLRDSERLEILNWSLALIKEAPLLGHGLLPQKGFVPLRGVYIGYPHNVFLASVIYAGIMAGIITCLLFARLFFVGVKDYRKSGNPFIITVFIFITIFALFDFSSLITPPRIEWVVFYLPIIFAIKQEVNFV